MSMRPGYQQRVLDEKAQLDLRLERLTAAFDSPTFRGLPEAEQNRMQRQASVMKLYSEVLGERIAAFAHA
jgi:hypothetical protein